MAYYRVEEKEIEPPPPLPPPAPLAADADARAKAEYARTREMHTKEHEAVVKETAARNARTAKSIEEWTTLVVDERTGQPVALCGGSVQAAYVAGLLNDRPPR